MTEQQSAIVVRWSRQDREDFFDLIRRCHRPPIGWWREQEPPPLGYRLRYYALRLWWRWCEHFVDRF